MQLQSKEFVCVLLLFLSLGCKPQEKLNQRKALRENELLSDFIFPKEHQLPIVYIDSFAVFRTELPDCLGIQTDFQLDTLVSKLLQIPIKIPPKYAKQYHYYPSRDLNKALTVTLPILFFTPFMPTKQKDQYVIGQYYLGIDRDSRYAGTLFWAVTIKKNKITSKKMLEPSVEISVWDKLSTEAF